MKILTAQKLKKDWTIRIVNTITVPCESDVYKTIKEQGLKTKKQFCSEDKGERTIIYAD